MQSIKARYRTLFTHSCTMQFAAPTGLMLPNARHFCLHASQASCLCTILGRGSVGSATTEATSARRAGRANFMEDLNLLREDWSTKCCEEKRYTRCNASDHQQLYTVNTYRIGLSLLCHGRPSPCVTNRSSEQSVSECGHLHRFSSHQPTWRSMA